MRKLVCGIECRGGDLWMVGGGVKVGWKGMLVWSEGRSG